jgi:CheY-like chemotaxis protein
MTGAGEHVVLVVEDDPFVRELVGDVLRDEGYTIVEATDGLEAIRMLDEHRPPPNQLCLMLLDMMLPHTDGVGVLCHLRQLGDYVPVVAMSASTAQLAAAAQAGAKTTIAKPFDWDAVLDVVAHHCRHHSGQALGPPC